MIFKKNITRDCYDYFSNYLFIENCITNKVARCNYSLVLFLQDKGVEMIICESRRL